MKRSMKRRAIFLVAGILGILALSSSSALAVAPPKINAFEPTEPYGSCECKYDTVTSKLMSAWVNPNGASTTYNIEYGTTKSLGATTPSVGIGSGTSNVHFEPVVKGLLPETRYYLRLVATNSAGTTTGAIISMYPELPGEWVAPTRGATYSSSGTFNINFASLGAEVICKSTGYGSIRHKGGIGDEFNIQPSSCGVYFSGKYSCSASIGTIRLNERLIATEQVWTVTTPESCPFFGGPFKVVVAEPFTAAKTSGEWVQISLPMAVESKATYGVYSATVTDSSTWQLTGENKGLSLGYWPGY